MDVADQMAEAAGLSNKVTFYNAGHTLNQLAKDDRISWLLEQLIP